MNQSSKIYVAGHTGMVGSAIVRKLTEQGYHNLILRTHKELNLTIQKDVDSFFDQERPEYVFMAAAKVGGIKANNSYMADYLMDNLLIQNNVIISAHNYKVNKLLFLASACIYPKECDQPIDEQSLLAGKLEPTNEGYAIAKIAGLKACEYYKKQYGDHFITAMPANSYGINDCFDPENSHVIPAMIHKFHVAKEQEEPSVTLWGSGMAKREFIYVDDLADACVFLMNQYDSETFINVGSGYEITIRDLAEKIGEVVGYKGEIVFDSTKPDGMMRRLINSSRLYQTGWRPKTTVEEGLRKLYLYYQTTEL
jgi:Nucleoside-diphosphate-sugar epimerases